MVAVLAWSLALAAAIYASLFAWDRRLLFVTFRPVYWVLNLFYG